MMGEGSLRINDRREPIAQGLEDPRKEDQCPYEDQEAKREESHRIEDRIGAEGGHKWIDEWLRGEGSVKVSRWDVSPGLS